MDVFAEDVPPELQEVGQMLVTARDVNLARLRVEVLQPRFGRADKVKDLGVLAEPTNKKKNVTRIPNLAQTPTTTTHCLNAGRYE